MKHRVLLSLLLALGCAHVRGAPVEQAGLEQGSCDDASAKAAAGLALTKINQDRKEGYVFSLHRLSNVHTAKNGDNGVVFYLTLDVVETNCSVLNRDDKKTCEARPTHDTPVYGQCKTAIYISRVNRVVRLYKYDCVIRPVPSARLVELCPDCPTLIGHDDVEVQKTVAASLEKFNKESGLAKRFALLNVTRATASMGMSTFYNVEYTVQEKCPLLDCEFTHKGFCKASHVHPPVGDAMTDVECDIYEPEAADREKKLHLKAEETDHSHNDTHTHAAAAADDKHDHAHDHAHAADGGAHTRPRQRPHQGPRSRSPHPHSRQRRRRRAPPLARPRRRQRAQARPRPHPRPRPRPRPRARPPRQGAQPQRRRAKPPPRLQARRRQPHPRARPRARPGPRPQASSPAPARAPPPPPRPRAREGVPRPPGGQGDHVAHRRPAHDSAFLPRSPRGRRERKRWTPNDS
uniref:Fetuin B n=1 Tax=Scophthalmus maximus TaxID=52904 RepID=A0A8D3B7J0_SCOMX